MIWMCVVIGDDGPNRVIAVPKPKGCKKGDLVAVRAKDVRSGMIAEAVSELQRVGEDGWGVTISKASGIKIGAQVAVELNPIDLEKWFRSETSVPLLKEAVE